MIQVHAGASELYRDAVRQSRNLIKVPTIYMFRILPYQMVRACDYQ